MMMDVRPIRNEADYQWALAQLTRYFDYQPDAGTPDADRFDVLSTLIDAYENRVHPMPEADPVDVLHFAIDTIGHTPDELGDLLGSRSGALEVLARRQPLSLEMIRTISAAWKLPIEALSQPYALATHVA